VSYPSRAEAYDAQNVSESVEAKLRSFVAERDWAQFHTQENLAKSIAIEAGELLECFQWSDEADLERIVDELADVLTYCHLLAQSLDLSTDEIVLAKLERTREKYPTDKARGRSTKYGQF
jgi:NTP pyrophosphatase (non-canonical NTP hydrolase)